MRLRYAGRAKDDLDIAFEWYEEQRRGLGFEFLDCVEVAIETIQQMPKLFAKHHADFRRALVQRFPFSIFYTIEEKEIVVHAVFDNRQDPARLP
ncbi:MAG: type II toxin-antitoxin system RelE/ParE family toxin [Deltaproteobacteria bacterium]|jgi:toxin ParE1/3/4|nr:type II toxin-antitoxin system RelE/ParE family toxin [Deltaproteobacteria bacterium]MBT6500959.1 type II toxin-antitoxin system RelE/ParE family toxin [Deltaproteobacteria bacterium]